jgi:quercetin dioxygenase-like cupin family protein
VFSRHRARIEGEAAACGVPAAAWWLCHSHASELTAARLAAHTRLAASSFGIRPWRNASRTGRARVAAQARIAAEEILTMSNRRYFVREQDVPVYHPANHTGTRNRRLIGRETVGSTRVEVVLGEIEKGNGALPHAHPGIEQVCYLLQGRARAEVAGEVCELSPGDSCFFPADVAHVFTVTSDEPARVLVIYSPPYEEDPQRVIR